MKCFYNFFLSTAVCLHLHIAFSSDLHKKSKIRENSMGLRVKKKNQLFFRQMKFFFVKSNFSNLEGSKRYNTKS